MTEEAAFLNLDVCFDVELLYFAIFCIVECLASPSIIGHHREVFQSVRRPWILRNSTLREIYYTIDRECTFEVRHKRISCFIFIVKGLLFIQHFQEKYALLLVGIHFC